MSTVRWFKKTSAWRPRRTALSPAVAATEALEPRVLLSSQPAPPVLVSPGSGTAPGPVLTSSSATFTWQPIADAKHYTVTLHDLTTGLDTIKNISGGPLEKSYTLPEGALHSGDAYSWDLIVDTGIDNFSRPSAPLYFTVKIVPPPTSSVLISPGSSTAPGPDVTTRTPTFTWTAAENATRYSVVLADLTTHDATAAEIDGSKTDYTLPAASLVPGDDYSWRVIAFNSSGKSFSNTLYFSTPGAAFVLSPGASTAPGPVVTTLTPTFTWQALRNIFDYRVIITDLTTKLSHTLYSGGQKTSIVAPAGTLRSGDDYSWQVVATSVGSNRLASDTLYFRTEGGHVVAPPAPVPTSPGGGTAPGPIVTTLEPTFTWKAVPGATGYKISILNETTHRESAQTITGGSTTSFTPSLGMLLSGYDYSWQVVATNSAGSATSALLFFKTEASRVGAPPAPVPTSPGSGTAPGPLMDPLLTPTFTWKAVPGATGYMIYLDNLTTNRFFAIPVDGGTTTHYSSANVFLKPKDRYVWYIYTISPAGSSGKSAPLHFQTP